MATGSQPEGDRPKDDNTTSVVADAAEPSA